MDKLKNLVQREKGETSASQSSQHSSRMTGQGSHFPSGDLASGAVTNPSTGTVPGTDARQGVSPGSTNLTPDGNSGSIAIGQTSTYSSYTLRKGDPVGSVVDPTSKDPTTFKMPEHTFGSASTGVPPGSANTAASVAFSKHRDPSTSDIPGAYPKDEPSAGSAYEPTTSAPSSSTTTGAPFDRSAESSQAENLQGISPAAYSQTSSSAPGAASVSSETPALPESQTSGTLGKILGAVGLGGAATGAGVAASRAGADNQNEAVADSPNQPTTTTGTDSYTAPTRSGPPPTHHRKESIPTTAYPAGPGSPSAVSAPVGGTRDAYTGAQDESHSSRNVGLAAAGIGAGAGATAVAAHQYGRSKPSTEATSYSIGGPSGVQNNSQTSGTPLSNAGVSTGEYSSLSGAGLYDQGISTGSTSHSTSSQLPGTALSTPGSTAQPASSSPAQSTQKDQTLSREAGWGPDPRTVDNSQTASQSSGHGKSTAAGILGAGAGAAGITALHSDRDPAAEQRTAEQAWQRSSATGPQTSTTESTYPSQNYPSTSASTYGTSSGPSAPTSGPGVEAHDEVDDKHTGRNAALAGAVGIGAGAYGAHEYNSRRTDPTASYDQSTYTAPSATEGYTESHSVNPNAPQPQRSVQPQSSRDINKDDSHIGRNAALAGATGTAAGAYGVHEYRKGTSEQDQSYPASTSHTSASDNKGYTTSKHTEPTSAASAGRSGAQDAFGESKEDESHGARNAALAGAAGAGAGAYGAREYNRHGDAQDSAPTRTTHEDPVTSTRDNTTSKPTQSTATPVHDKSTKGKESHTDKDKDDSHDGRNAALAATAGAGAGAYGAHEISSHHAEEEAARRKQDLAEQEAARQKQFEKDQKAAEKLAAKEAKQHEKDVKKAEKHYQKDLEKEEKKHAKEEEKAEKKHVTALEKEDLARQKSAEKEEQKHQRQFEKEEEDERKRREKEAAFAAGTGTGVAAAYGAHEHNKHDDHEHERNRLHKDPPQKKPSIFKRIFKSRKNKDTGEDEQYSTDEEDTTARDHHLEEAGAITGAGTATAATGTSSDTKSYEALSGGAQKPSYNPLHKNDQPEITTGSNTGLAAGSTSTTAGSSAPYTITQDQRQTGQTGGYTGGAGRDNIYQDTATDRAHRQPISSSQEPTGAHAEAAGDHDGEHRKESLGHRILEQLKPLPTTQELRRNKESE